MVEVGVATEQQMEDQARTGAEMEARYYFPEHQGFPTAAVVAVVDTTIAHFRRIWLEMADPGLWLSDMTFLY
jgi:hypothetical protein